MRALGPFTQKQEGPVLSRLWDGDSVSPPLWPDVGQCRGVTTWAKVHNSLWGALGMAEGGDRGNKPSCNAGGGEGGRLDWGPRGMDLPAPPPLVR